jgi:hypothetical protein
MDLCDARYWELNAVGVMVDNGNGDPGSKHEMDSRGEEDGRLISGRDTRIDFRIFRAGASESQDVGATE